MEKALKDKFNIATRIRKALGKNEFFLNYQPQVFTSTGEMTGVEALLWWNSKTDLPIGPDQFIPILEETGLICSVGEWVLETACRQVVTWHWMGTPINLSVNVSTRQFQDGTLPETVSTILTATGFDPTRLCLEITESLLIDNTDRVINQITALNAIGVSFSIDDFGTGYSSMSYLQKLPIKEVKIDKSFIQDLPHNQTHLAIVKSLVGIAHALDMSVIAEGVEKQEQVVILRESGVTNAQGYFYGKPVPGSDITSLLKV
jgi:EAL domain-containing protein (putative c-di-GMP-specific phosphodiesterase class I)